MTPRAGRAVPVELRISRTPPCPRCAAPVALVVRHPHTWRNRAGARVGGCKETALCGTCDRDDPLAARLLSLLARSAGTSGAHLDEAVGGLLLDWLDAVRARVPCEADLGAEEARWRAGTL
ncbi:DUF6300 family protein [Streptomyces sp. NPDC056161]|uniref:DUF6300 family protein n=1 Tax=Streptomyces sp. NPDC056161 TaxID=3345732 RepID=UPI0035DA706D